MHLPSLIIDLALILASAAVIAIVFRKIKQPIVLGYILAGFLVGPNLKYFPTIHDAEGIKVWADIGVIFLLFGLGLEFSLKKMIKLGMVVFVTALIEISLTMLVGFTIGNLFGWSMMNSLFLGGILAIASTTIIIKAFDEGGYKNQKFAGIVTGILVIEDLVAVLLLVLLSSIATSTDFEGVNLIQVLLKLVFFLTLWFVAGIYFLPTLLKKMSKVFDSEILLIFSLALCFVMVVVASNTGFSSALGAFIMGSVLSETVKSEKIVKITASLRDLFGAIFFVSVGMLIEPSMLIEYYVEIIICTLVLLFGKPLFVVFGSILTGQPLKTAIQTGMSLSQIGEFSFILASLGLSLKVTGSYLYPIAVSVSVITAFTTPYMIRLSDPLYRFLDTKMPTAWRQYIDKFSSQANILSEYEAWKVYMRAFFINVLINTVMVLAIILFGIDYLLMVLGGYSWGKFVVALLGFAFISPFLWALGFNKFQLKSYNELLMKMKYRGPLILIQIVRLVLVVLFIGILFYKLFSPLVAFVSILVAIGLLAAFSSRIGAMYLSIESRFLTNLSGKENNQKYTTLLAPWDSHISRFTIPYSSSFVFKSLPDLRLRELYGVNIVLIERGEEQIPIPGKNDYIFPNDVVSVLGTDVQIQQFSSVLEKESIANVDKPQTVEVTLIHFELSEFSMLLGKSIKDSGIREKVNGIVVGVERNGQRIINPESSFVFIENDILWLVGDIHKMHEMMHELAG